MSSRDRSLLAVVVLIVIAVGGYFLIVQPEHSKANKLQVQIGAEQTALSQAEAAVQAGEAAEAQYKTYAKQLKLIAAAVPADAQIPQLINELQAASTKTKVSFQSFTAGGSNAASGTATSGGTAITFPSQSFSMTFTGSYFAVANLLGKLASFVRADDRQFHVSGRLLSISSVAESAGGTGTASAGGDSGVITANVSALDYDIPTTTTSTAG